jgi:hypothetical protein
MRSNPVLETEYYGILNQNLKIEGLGYFVTAQKLNVLIFESGRWLY